MLGNSTTTQTTQHAPAQKPGAAQKLEQARNRIRFAQRSVTASEGRLLDFETAEEISRALAAVSRDLEELTLQMAVMARKAVR
jgi:hypothetical protein